MDLLHEEWEKNYEKDHGEKSKELEELARGRASDQVHLVSQQTRWERDNAGKVALMTESTMRIQEEKEYRKLLEKMHLAQCTIRFYWKVYWRARKKELKKLKRKKMARLRAQKKAEKDRPPSFGNKKTKSEDEGGNITDGGAASGTEGPSKPGTAAAAASKPQSAAASGKTSGR